jgi:hypothetical protein
MLLSAAYDPRPHGGLDGDLVEDVCVVFRLASRTNSYPDTLGYGPQLEAVVRLWRPELLEDKEL